VKIFRWALPVALVACATPQSAGDHVTVVWNRVDDVQTVCQSLAGRKEVFAIRGCSKWNDTDRSGQRVCSIYVPTPKNETDTQTFATLGHELMHCFDGNWHDRWGRMTPQETQAAAGASRKRAGAAVEAN
jgi:hypothetical protein